MLIRIPAALSAALFLLSGCATPGDRALAPHSTSVQIIALNDLHGNLEPPKLAIEAPAPGGSTVKVPAGGVAYLASAIAGLRKGHADTITVSAGDMIGASPLVSALFLDEPTIAAMNLAGVGLNAVGNHEFDQGRAELKRMQQGGCAKLTAREPCRVESFAGASFPFLAANTLTETGDPLFGGSVLREFGKGARRVTIGFIGVTLKATATYVTPAGIAGLRFADEADTVNALVPKLRAAGADAIVLVIHEGLRTKVGFDDKSCDGVSGDLLAILARLDPAVDLVVSGHTHSAYICDYGRIDPARPFLVTSAGSYGTMLTDITLEIDPKGRRVTAKRADNMIVQGEGFSTARGETPVTDLYPRQTAEPRVAALVNRYVEAAKPLVTRVVGKLAGPATKELTPSREQVLGDLIADSQLAATRAADAGGAQLAFMNPGGVRASIEPAADGGVTFGQLFATQPFNNTLMVKTFSGRDLRDLLEEQFEGGTKTTASPMVLLPSANFRYGYDLSRPKGQRIVDPRLDGKPLSDTADYRVTMNNFLASGGDGFTIFAKGRDAVGGISDVEAFERYLAGASAPMALPVPNRIRNLTPAP
jgi:5'-nucleotidase